MASKDCYEQDEKVINENQQYLDNSCSSKSNVDKRGFHQNLSNQSQLPPKKRFGTTLENSYFSISKEAETYKSPWIPKQQMTNRGMEKNLQMPEPRKVTILPGVIRHTSCPDRPLAYYNSYEKI